MLQKAPVKVIFKQSDEQLGEKNYTGSFRNLDKKSKPLTSTKILRNTLRFDDIIKNQTIEGNSNLKSDRDSMMFFADHSFERASISPIIEKYSCTVPDDPEVSDDSDGSSVHNDSKDYYFESLICKYKDILIKAPRLVLSWNLELKISFRHKTNMSSSIKYYSVPLKLCNTNENLSIKFNSSDHDAVIELIYLFFKQSVFYTSYKDYIEYSDKERRAVDLLKADLIESLLLVPYYDDVISIICEKAFHILHEIELKAARQARFITVDEPQLVPLAGSVGSDLLLNFFKDQLTSPGDEKSNESCVILWQIREQYIKLSLKTWFLVHNNKSEAKMGLQNVLLPSFRNYLKGDTVSNMSLWKESEKSVSKDPAIIFADCNNKTLNSQVKILKKLDILDKDSSRLYFNTEFNPILEKTLKVNIDSNLPITMLSKCRNKKYNGELLHSDNTLCLNNFRCEDEVQTMIPQTILHFSLSLEKLNNFYLRNFKMINKRLYLRFNDYKKYITLIFKSKTINRNIKLKWVFKFYNLFYLWTGNIIHKSSRYRSIKVRKSRQVSYKKIYKYHSCSKISSIFELRLQYFQTENKFKENITNVEIKYPRILVHYYKKISTLKKKTYTSKLKRSSNNINYLYKKYMLKNNIYNIKRIKNQYLTSIVRKPRTYLSQYQSTHYIKGIDIKLLRLKYLLENWRIYDDNIELFLKQYKNKLLKRNRFINYEQKKYKESIICKEKTTKVNHLQFLKTCDSYLYRLKNKSDISKAIHFTVEAKSLHKKAQKMGIFCCDSSKKESDYIQTPNSFMKNTELMNKLDLSKSEKDINMPDKSTLQQNNFEKKTISKTINNKEEIDIKDKIDLFIDFEVAKKGKNIFFNLSNYKSVWTLSRDMWLSIFSTLTKDNLYFGNIHEMYRKSCQLSDHERALCSRGSFEIASQSVSDNLSVATDNICTEKRAIYAMSAVAAMVLGREDNEDQNDILNSLDIVIDRLARDLVCVTLYEKMLEGFVILQESCINVNKSVDYLETKKALLMKKKREDILKLQLIKNEEENEKIEKREQEKERNNQAKEIKRRKHAQILKASIDEYKKKKQAGKELQIELEKKKLREKELGSHFEKVERKKKLTNLHKEELIEAINRHKTLEMKKKSTTTKKTNRYDYVDSRWCESTISQQNAILSRFSNEREKDIISDADLHRILIQRGMDPRIVYSKSYANEAAFGSSVLNRGPVLGFINDTSKVSVPDWLKLE